MNWEADISVTLSNSSMDDSINYFSGERKATSPVRRNSGRQKNLKDFYPFFYQCAKKMSLCSPKKSNGADACLRVPFLQKTQFQIP